MPRSPYFSLTTAASLLVLLVAIGCGGGSGSPTAATPPGAPPPSPTPVPAPMPDAEAVYRVTFDATWSAASHAAPSNPHFSGLIGATHLEDTRFWEVGTIASDGIKAMAEMGSKSPLDSEIQAALGAGTAENLLSGGFISPSPGVVRLQFTASIDHPYVTLVSMIAPSPDWFVGVSALSLMEDGDWADRIVVDLLPYDAGTDDGKNFTSPNRPLAPRQPIAHIDDAPLAPSGSADPLGTFTFRRID